MRVRAKHPIGKVRKGEKFVMKKKIQVLVMAVLFAMGVVACAGKATQTENLESAGSSLEVFDKIWSLYAEDDKFAAIGGSFANPVDGNPGNYEMTDQEGLIGMFYIPEAQIDKVDDVATLMHMMNANTFTGAVVHVSDVDTFAAQLKTNIESTQWVCGFPDQLIIAEAANGYVAYAFGEASLMKTYEEKMSKAYPGVRILYQVDLASMN